MATQKAATKMPGRSDKGKGGIELYSPTYFGACALGGIISCGPTHTCWHPMISASAESD